MAEVHLARSVGIQGFEKQVVLKRILPQFADQKGFVRMFLDEARLAATLHHPNIVQVFDIGEYAGNYYFAMEYLRGRDVREILARAQRKRVKLPLGVAISIGMGVCAGLHYAHEKNDGAGTPLGIVHRDVSPSNVIVTHDGSSKVLDFGVAKAASHQTQTRAGTLKGKIAYMSPEQCRGEALDRMSDVFSIGILLFEMTTGTRLFKGGSELEILNKIASEDAPSPALRRPDYPEELERIVRRALSRDKLARYRSARDLQRDLESFARDERLSTSPLDVAELLTELFPEDFGVRPAPAPRGKRKVAKLSDEPSVLIVDCFSKDGEDDEDDDDQDPRAASTRRLPSAPPPIPGPRGTGPQDALANTGLLSGGDAPRPTTRVADGASALESLLIEENQPARADSTADSVSALLAESQKSLAELARAQRRARTMTGIGAALIGAAVAAFVFGGGALPGASAPAAAPAPVPAPAPVATAADVSVAVPSSALNESDSPTDQAAPTTAVGRRQTNQPAERATADEPADAAQAAADDSDEAPRDDNAGLVFEGEAEVEADSGGEPVEKRRQRRKVRRDRKAGRASARPDRKAAEKKNGAGWNPDSALLPGM